MNRFSLLIVAVLSVSGVSAHSESLDRESHELSCLFSFQRAKLTPTQVPVRWVEVITPHDETSAAPYFEHKMTLNTEANSPLNAWVADQFHEFAESSEAQARSGFIAPDVSIENFTSIDHVSPRPQAWIRRGSGSIASRQRLDFPRSIGVMANRPDPLGQIDSTLSFTVESSPNSMLKLIGEFQYDMLYERASANVSNSLRTSLPFTAICQPTTLKRRDDPRPKPSPSPYPPHRRCCRR